MIRAAALALCLLAMPVMAQDIRQSDLGRLERLPATLDAALARATSQGAPGDIAVLDDALTGAFQFADPSGDWSCRTLKLGDLVPLVVYRNFACRITDQGDGSWVLEKLTGSQRMQGRLFLDEAGMIYLGVGFTGEAPAVSYADFPAADIPIDPGQTVPQIGEAIPVGLNKLRIVMPEPLLESQLDILLLTR